MNDNELTPEQIAVRNKFVKDLRTAMPSLVEIGKAAKKVHNDFITAPVWHLADAPKAPDFTEPPPQEWSVGHAQVNYVDHIDTPLDDEQ